jgi:N-methylhydantoinase B
MCGCNTPDVEMEESTQPGYILWRRVSKDQAGAGTHRGGMGVSGALAIIHTEVMTGGAYNSAAYIPPRGAAGGYPAGAGDWQLLTETNVFELLEQGEWPTERNLKGRKVQHPAKTGNLILRRGDVFSVINGGGGGVGDPLFRVPDAVAKDVRDGYVSVEVASLLYGVVLDSEQKVNVKATARRRETIRAERIDRTPERTVDGSGPVFAPLAVSNGRWACTLCGTDLGSDTDNWRTAAVTRESKVSERYEEFRSQVRVATSTEPVVMRENFCPGCATSLAVDVTLMGHGPAAAPRVGIIDPYMDVE